MAGDFQSDTFSDTEGAAVSLAQGDAHISANPNHALHFWLVHA